MLRWISENIKKDRPVKMGWSLLMKRWWGLAWDDLVMCIIRKMKSIQVERMEKGEGRPKITLIEIVKKNMPIKEVTKSMILDRIE